MSASQAPRDSVAHTQLFVPVDATGADFYDLGQRFGTQVAVLTEVQSSTNHRFAKQTGAWDPRCLRWHDLKRRTPVLGLADRRLCVQVVNDYDAEYADVRAGDAPFGQPEVFTSANRSTREVDTAGRVALPSSHRRIVDSEDDRYALGLTCRSIGLAAATNEIAEAKAEASTRQQNVQIRQRGASGGVTRLTDSVSVGGVTFFGAAVVAAARRAIEIGEDAAQAASAAATGRTTPRPQPEPDVQIPVQADLDPPTPPSAHSVPLLDHPAGYVWSTSDRIGLLGTLVVPEGASGHYFTGREGTRIGPLPWRHDAQVSMGPSLVGRIVFVADDAASVKRGTGRPIKGELWSDSSRANRDTELGLETAQWRPVIRVDADLPPRYPPPPPPWEPPPPKEPKEDEEDDDEEEEEQQGGNRGGKTRRPQRPPAGRPESPLGGILVGGGGYFELPPVRNPEGQARDFSGPGVPCPNKTAGVLLGPEAKDELGVVRVPGGYVQWLGYPALTPVPGGVVVGGLEQPIEGRVSDQPVTPEDPGGRAIPIGLPPTKEETGVVVLPPLGGARGIPRGYGERYEKARRRWLREQAEAKRLRQLEELEQKARDAGRERYAERVRRARERLEAKRKAREERRERLRQYKERKRKEAAERRERRKERVAERRRRARERRERWRRKRKRPTAPQSGYMVDLRNPDLDSLTPEQRRLLERDVARGWLDPAILGLEGQAPEQPAMGQWNVANAPLPFLGHVRSLEQWANLATYQLRALQRIVLGAFGGPDYLASNLALVDRSGTGHLLAGCGARPVLTVRACEGVALCVEGDLVVKGTVTELSDPPEASEQAAQAAGLPTEEFREIRPEGRVELENEEERRG